MALCCHIALHHEYVVLLDSEYELYNARQRFNAILQDLAIEIESSIRSDEGCFLMDQDVLMQMKLLREILKISLTPLRKNSLYELVSFEVAEKDT